MQGRRTPARVDPGKVTNWMKAGTVVLGILAGYILGGAVMETADVLMKSSASSKPVTLSSGSGATGVSSSGSDAAAVKPAAEKAGGHTIHSLLTSNGSPYQNFQGRIMYGTYKLVQKMPGGDQLTGFTRILHRMKPDELMNEIPTFRANPLHPECDQWCDFPVADRPNAVRQWIDAAARDPAMITGAWVLLLECDYVWMKPVQAPDAYDSTAVGFQFMFDYIMPAHPDAVPHMNRLSGGKVSPEVIPRSGPAPVLIRYTDLAGVVPEWERITAAIEADKAAVKQLDWVREMYAWDIALALRNVTLVTESPPRSRLLAQPPHDLVIGDAAMLHYTWGTLYYENKKEIWRWEKRDYTSREVALQVPTLKMPPQPWKQGWVIQDGLPVTRELHETMTAMIGQMNKAIATLPDLLHAQHA